jgi:hypothetical protein
MKKKIIMGIAVMVGLVIAILFFAGSGNDLFTSMGKNETDIPDSMTNDRSDQTLGGLSHEIILEKSLPGEVKNIMVYKTVPSQFTRQDVISLGKKFNIPEPTEIKETKEGFSIAAKDGSAYVLLLNSGWIEYTNSIRDTVNPFDVPANLPSDDEAEKIATRFLEDRDLLPSGATVIRTTHGQILGTSSKGSDAVVWEDINVWYGRKLSGYPVEGTQLMLAIGAHGDPIEFIMNWRNYESYKELAVKTPEQAFQELKTNGVAVGVMDKPDKISINDMYLAYKTKPASEKEEYLEPVWVFKGEVFVDGKPVMPVVQYVPAVAESPGESVSTSSITTASTTAQPTSFTYRNESAIQTSNSSVVITTLSTTIANNDTAVSPVPSEVESVTAEMSLNVTQNVIPGNATAE